MTPEEFETISKLLKLHYGATQVSLDNDLLIVYGSDVDAVYVSVVVEYGHKYDILYEYRDERRNYVVLKLVNKTVDKHNKKQ